MNRFLSLSLLLTTLTGTAQEKIKQYVQQHTVPIAAIQPDSTDYSDLAAIGDAIGESRIVMLGEQDHGDAPTFLAKTRLIKYLHEKKGFNVLAFESDFFALNYRDTKGAMDFIYPIWTYCDACQGLFKSYLPAQYGSATPLKLAGLDCQIFMRSLAPVLDSLIRALSLKKPAGYSDSLWTNSIVNAKDSSLNARYRSCLDDLQQQLKTKLPAGDFWLQLMETLQSANLQYRTRGIVSMNARDSQMAANLHWLSETKYPKEKIIVWAHNYHVSKYSGHYPQDFMNGFHMMGSVYTRYDRMAAQTYILGFTSFEGTAGRLTFKNTYRLPKPVANGFERWIRPELPFAFVDFKAYNQANPTSSEIFDMAGAIINGPLGQRYHADTKAEWNKVYDGVFFIREMYPCKAL